MQKIKGVIFDLDGTLANTLPLCIQAFRQSVEPLTLQPLSDEEIIATFGPSGRLRWTFGQNACGVFGDDHDPRTRTL